MKMSKMKVLLLSAFTLSACDGPVDLETLGYSEISLCGTVQGTSGPVDGKKARFTLRFTERGTPWEVEGEVKLDAKGRGCIGSASDSTTVNPESYPNWHPANMEHLWASVHIDGYGGASGILTPPSMSPECDPDDTDSQYLKSCGGTLSYEGLFDYGNSDSAPASDPTLINPPVR